MIVKCNFSQIYSLVQIEANILSIFDNCIDYYKFLMVNLYIYIYIYRERERERERERVTPGITLSNVTLLNIF